MTQLADMPDVMSIEEAAKFLKIGRIYAYELAKRGEFPGMIQIGKRRKVSKSALESFLRGE